MSNLVSTIIGGVIVAIIIAIFGIGGSTMVKVQGGYKPSRTGKWIMIISVIVGFIGLIWATNNPTLVNSKDFHPGYALAIISVGFFFIGKLINWFQ